MKNLFALLFSSLIVLSSNSQSIISDFEQESGINNFETPFLTNKNLKSIKATKQQLDSIVADYYISNTNEWYTWLQTTYTYDEFGNLTEYIEYSHSNESIIPYAKKEFTYTADGDISQQLIYNWDSYMGSYTLYYQEDYVYNNSGALIEFVAQGTWEDKLENTAKTEYEYENGNLLSNIHYEWKGQQWTESWKMESVYDGTSLINHKFFSWSASNNQFEISKNHNYYYNADHNLIKMESYNYYGSDSLKRIYEYNEQNKLMLEKQLLKEENNGSWVNTRKTVYTYDDEMNMLEESSYDWNALDIEWDIYLKKAYAYAENANLTEFAYYEGRYTDDLIPQYKYTYEYNISFSFEDLVLPSLEKSYNSGLGLGHSSLYYDSIENKHMKTSHSLYGWNVNDQEWKLNNNSHYYYSDKFIDGVQDNIDNEIIVYPNPASEFIVFETQDASYPIKVIIYDMQGKTVLEKDLSDSKLSIKGMNSGMYCYQILYDAQIINGKFIVE